MKSLMASRGKPLSRADVQGANALMGIIIGIAISLLIWLTLFALALKVL